MKWVLIGLVRVYQYTLSPLLGDVCRYYPSCSHYAVEALLRHGSIKGSWLTVRRLGRCHPWAPGGVDPVPPLRTATAVGAPSHRESDRGSHGGSDRESQRERPSNPDLGV